MSMEKPDKIQSRQCIQELIELRDIFDALSGKWKLPLLQYLYNRQDEPNGFRKIEQGIAGISDKMLAKELKQLESNHLIIRSSSETTSSGIIYSISEHGKTAIPVIEVLVSWGRSHRELAKAIIR